MGLANAVKNNEDVQIVHTHKPVFRKDLKYLIVARNPLSRAISAFRWRYKLVVEDGAQRDRFAGEYEVLLKYGSLNALAESLYDVSGKPNIQAHIDIRKVHHLREDIAFYISELLDKCNPEQIIAVLMQESLNEDLFRVFGYRNELETHKNPQKKGGDGLSVQAELNLKHFLYEDYNALTKLYCLGKINRETFLLAM